MEVNKIKPSTAFDEKDSDVRVQLSMSDYSYLEQPDAGNEVIVKYDAPIADEELRQTVVLHTRGYYERIRSYEEKPNVKYLKTFKNAGAMDMYSKKKYNEICKDIGIIASNPK